jgi:TetR/AcrR family transcriptional regulator, regulator of autoinduction and epiphytic fitness
LSRKERALATRRNIVESATRLFIEDGYSETTMERVAESAGVAVQTVYYVFGTKGHLLCDATEYIAAGAHDPDPVESRAWMVDALSTPLPLRSLAIAVENGTDIYRRAAPLWPAMSAAAVTDEAVASYWEGVTVGRKAGMRRLVAHVAGHAGLAQGLDVETATDIMFTINSHATFQDLVIDSGWTVARFKEWLFTTLARQLFPDELDTSEAKGSDFADWLTR